MAQAQPNNPASVSAVILPGWMTRQDAINLLTAQCVGPQFDTAQAADVWEQYHQRVEALPEREATATAEIAIIRKRVRRSEAISK